MAWFDQDYVIRFIQQSQDKKSLLTHVYRRHRREEKHKVNNKKVKEELLLRKTIVTY